MRRDDLSGGDFERCKQCRRAVALVVVALAGQSAAIGQLQIALRSLQSLDRRLFVHGAEVEPAPLLLEIGVLVVDLMQAALRVSARFGKVMLNRAEAAKIVSDR